METDAFVTMLGLVLTEYDVGTIPVSLDRVTCGSIDRVCKTGIPHLLVLGVNDGVLPSAGEGGGILSDCDRAYGLDEVLASYRVRAGSISSTRKSKLIKYYWELYRDIERLSNIKSSAAIASLVFFKSIRQTDERIQKVRNNFNSKQTSKLDLTNIEKNPENAVKITNASEDITFERTKENNIPATADNSNDAEYAQK